MWDALPVRFIGRSTGKGSPTLNMSRELYHVGGGNKKWGKNGSRSGKVG